MKEKKKEQRKILPKEKRKERRKRKQRKEKRKQSLKKVFFLVFLELRLLGLKTNKKKEKCSFSLFFHPFLAFKSHRKINIFLFEFG